MVIKGAEGMSQEMGKAEARAWTREEIWDTLKGILIDSLGVREEEVVPGASLVDDLGAESIDFLDIGFKVQQAFGVGPLTKELQDRIMTWRGRLVGELAELLEAHYGLVVSPEEVRAFQALGVRAILKRLCDERGIQVRDHEARDVAKELTRRLAKELQAFSFEVSGEDEQAIVDLMLADLTSPKIVERIRRMFTVEVLVNFIAAKASIRPGWAEEG